MLICDLALKHGPYYTADGLNRLFHCMAIQCTIGLASAAVLLRSNWQKLALAGTAGAKASGGSSYGQKGEVIELRLVPGWGDKVSSRGVLGGSSKGHYQSQYGSGSVQHLGEQGYNGHGSTAAVAVGELDGVVVDVEAAAMKRHGATAVPAGAVAAGSTSSSSSVFDPQRYNKGAKKGKRFGLVKRGLQEMQQGATAVFDQVKVLLPLLRAIMMPAVALLLSVGSSMLAFPFFTYVPTNGAMGAHVHQVGNCLNPSILHFQPWDCMTEFCFLCMHSPLL